MLYQYQYEMGTILAPGHQILRIANGNLGSVDFPEDIVWDLHKQSLGIIYAFAHTHPPTMDALSPTDMKMFKGWAWALYPFSIRMMLITQITDGIFVSKQWLGQIETKAEWIKRGKDGARRFTSYLETSKEIDMRFHQNPNMYLWEELLIKHSYTVQNNR